MPFFNLCDMGNRLSTDIWVGLLRIDETLRHVTMDGLLLSTDIKGHAISFVLVMLGQLLVWYFLYISVIFIIYHMTRISHRLEGIHQTEIWNSEEVHDFRFLGVLFLFLTFYSGVMLLPRNEQSSLESMVVWITEPWWISRESWHLSSNFCHESFVECWHAWNRTMNAQK